MGLWSRIFGRAKRTAIAQAVKGEIIIEGRVEEFDPDALVGDPISGDLCVYIHYEAFVPSYAQRLMFGAGRGSLNLVAKSAQAVAFVVRDDSGAALVRPAAGADLLALHRELLSRHGLEMQAYTSLIRVGDRVRVDGQVVGMTSGSPMRREPHSLTIEARRIELMP